MPTTPLWRMSDDEFKAWLITHRISGLAAAAAQKKRRRQIAKHTYETGQLDGGLTDGAQRCDWCGTAGGACDCQA